MEVDPQTCDVWAAGVLLACEPAEVFDRIVLYYNGNQSHWSHG